MEHFDSNEKKWILSKYAKFVRLNSNDPNSGEWKNLDSSECDSPIYISITPSNFLQIRYDNEYLESINLWNVNNDMKLCYKEKSFLILHRMKTFVRKFRVQFLDDPNSEQAALKNCESCIKELSKFMPTEPFDKPSEQQLVEPNETNLTSRSEKCSLKDIVQLLINNNEHKLPLIYSSGSTGDETNKEDSVLEEFIVNCLLDTSFVSFVTKVDQVLSNIVTRESNL